MIGYIRKSVVLFANKPLQFVLMERKMNVGPQAGKTVQVAHPRASTSRWPTLPTSRRPPSPRKARPNQRQNSMEAVVQAVTTVFKSSFRSDCLFRYSLRANITLKL